MKLLKDYQSYIRKIHEGANCHAPNILNILEKLESSVLRYASEFRTRNGKSLGNVIWITFKSETYCFCYNHETEKIEVRKRNQLKKNLVATFDNQSDPGEVETFIRNL